jgi:hypothetical protein
MADDYLKSCSVDQVAAWYLRLAAAWDKNMPELQPALAGSFLRTWVTNRNKDAKIEFDAPQHLRSHSSVFAVQSFHREVFLSNKRARFSGGTEKWVGILPRIQGAPGFTRWDMKGDLPLEYESLCDVAPDIWAIAKIQRSGSNADRDIFGSLRGFQLKSKVTVTVVQPLGPLIRIMFKNWQCSGADRYDWNYSEHLTVVNPDYGSKAADAIRPGDRTLAVYHTNAKRLEDAGKAAPYHVILRPWTVADARLTAPSNVDTKRRL